MTHHLLRQALAVLARAATLLVSGILLWRLLRGRGPSLEEMLFYVGALPIVLQTLGRMGEFRGRASETYQLGRSVMRASAGRRGMTDHNDLGRRERAGWPWIAAGLLVWACSYLLSVFSG